MIVIFKVLISSLFLLTFSLSAYASHCYSYTTKHYFELLPNNNVIDFRLTIKDWNEISYVSQKTIQLKDIPNTNFRIISDDGAHILFTAGDYYYLVKKDMYQVEKYGASKLFEKSSVKQVVSNQFFLIGNKWHYIRGAHYSSKFGDITLPQLGSNLEILANYNRGEILLKDNKNVYIFYENKVKLQVIPKLDPNSTFFKESDNLYGKHFLYDDNTFYLTSIRFIYQDITESFNSQGKFERFSKADFSVNKTNISLDTHDDKIWLYLNGGTASINGDHVYFYPIEASYLNKSKDLYVYNNNVYNSSWGVINNHKSLDISAVSNIDSLHCLFLNEYSDGIFTYKIQDNSNQLIPIDPSPRSYDRIDSLKQLYPDIRQIGLTYIYSDKLYIERKEIENISKTQNLEFIGSTVNIINECDAFDMENNRYTSVKVSFNYFFKDNKQVYSYVSNDSELKVVPHVLPEDYKSNEYADLIALTEKM